MKIIITGSLGHISKPLTIELVQKGHQVTVISSKPDKQKDIGALGAMSAIGSLEDADFLIASFAGADAVYTMVPPANYFDQNLDVYGYYERIGKNYAQALKAVGVSRVVNLSTIGGHLNKGNGILRGAHNVENILNELASDVAITHIRPTEYYYNLLPQVHSAKSGGFMASNIGGGVTNVWVDPLDIAAAFADEITTPTTGRKIRYVASEEITYNELTRIIGEAIGKPDLKWLTLTDEQMESGAVAIGMQPKIAAGLTEMYAAINSGLLYEDYKLHRPATILNVKVEDFAKEFAIAFNK